MHRYDFPAPRLGRQRRGHLGMAARLSSTMASSVANGGQRMEKRATARDLFDAIYGLRTFLVGYDEALIQASLALLTRNHMFLVGPTGQGKSTFLTLLSEVFDRVAVFR